jgi:hypothetical protein
LKEPPIHREMLQHQGKYQDDVTDLADVAAFLPLMKPPRHQGK